MSKVGEHVRVLRELDDPEPCLLEHPGLPGPRGVSNSLGPLRSCARRRNCAVGRRSTLTWPHGRRRGVLAFCGVVGLGRLLAEGGGEVLADLRGHANAPRWRLREAVAMALQRWRADEFDLLAAAMGDSANGTWRERAAAAALCEPALLTDGGRVKAVLTVLEEVTAGVASAGPGRA